MTVTTQQEVVHTLNLPKWIADKKACINIKNEDNKCAKYSTQCGFHNVHEQKNPQEIRHYSKIEDTIKLGRYELSFR